MEVGKRTVNMTFERVDFDNVVGFHPRLDENYQYKQPQQREDKWLTSTLEEETTHFTRIYDLVKDIINEKYKDIHSLLIVKNNKLVLEEYFYGYSADDLNGIQSASKSFWSALLGIAFQQGAIKDINQSICPYVGKWDDKQILPKSWVAEATTKQISTGGQDNEGYGYFWWTRSFKREGKAIDYYYAWGYGGQYIFVVPEMNMVVVFTGSSWKMNDPTYFEIMDNYLIE